MNKKDVRKALEQASDQIFRSLQTAKARRALERAFRATPAEMGRAALREHKKKR